MYKGHSIWDEEQEKYDNIITDREENKSEYRNQRDYASGDNPSDVYSTEKGEEEKKKEDEATGIERDVMKEEKKYDKKEEVSEEGIKRKAASKVHQEGKNEDTESKKKKEHKSIEDAINKAMKEEKGVIYLHE